MAWQDVVIEKIGTTVTWTVDGLLIATVPIDGITFGGEDIVFGMFDINANASTDPNDFLNATVFDNIVVQTIPEPTTLGLLAMAGATLGFRRCRIQSSVVVRQTYSEPRPEGKPSRAGGEGTSSDRTYRPAVLEVC
jgi:hypothetical protein